MQCQHDSATVAQMNQPFGLVVRDVPRDGNCMFSAVIIQLSGEHSHYTAETLRQTVRQYLGENPYIYAERTSHYRDFLADAVATDDTYNADTEAPNEEDKYTNSIEDPDERAELKWQNYLRRLQTGAYADDSTDRYR